MFALTNFTKFLAFGVCCIIHFTLVSSIRDASDANGDILSVDSCGDILSITKVDSYQPLSLNYPTFKKWPYLEKIQKAVYLIDRSHLINVKREYQQLQQLKTLETTHATTKQLQESETFVAVPLDSDNIAIDSTSHSRNSKQNSGEWSTGISLKVLVDEWGEFTASKTLVEMFQECDTNFDAQFDWLEYLMCRNNYNQYGAPYDVSELDYMENIVLYDFQQRLNDPMDPMTQELLARDEL